MTDASLVSAETVRGVLDEMSRAGPGDALQGLAAREPVLGAYVSERMLVLSGKLALSGAPPETVQACYDEMLKLVAVSVRAIWRGSDDLWKGVDVTRITGRGVRRRRSRAVRAEVQRGDGGSTPATP